MIRFTILAGLLCAAAPLARGERIAVAHKWADSIGIYDVPSGRQLSLIAVGVKPHEFAFTRDFRTAYVTHYGINSYTEKAEGGNTIGIVDLAAATMTGEISTGKYRRPHGIELGRSGKLYVTTELPPALLLIDPVKRALIRAVEIDQPLPHMLALTHDESTAWTANAGGGSVSVVDLVAGRIIKRIEIGGVPMGIGLSKDERTLYAGNRGGNRVYSIETKNHTILRQAEVRGEPARLLATPNGKWVIVSLIGSGEVAVLEAETLREVARFAAGRAAEGLQLHPSGKFGYVSAQGQNRVVKFAIPGWTRVAEVATGDRPDPIVVLPDR
ncbi:MAG TPA: hypothetical protein DEH78_13285 [Solibacterales bacterium]|nr:hypothetical protein [Bryobacterales bacterium]